MSCNLDNKLRSVILKHEWSKLKENIEKVKILEIEINQLENNFRNQMPIQDPYHPNNMYYLQRKALLENYKLIIDSSYRWIQFFSAKIIGHTKSKL